MSELDLSRPCVIFAGGVIPEKMALRRRIDADDC